MTTKKHEEVKKGDRVKVDYVGTFDDGEVFDQSKHGDHSHPLEFEVGARQVIKGFDDALIGMKIGETKDIRINPEEAYGPHNPAHKQKVPKKHIPSEEELKPGMMLMVGLPTGERMPVKIIDTDSETVTIDFNHPMAGKTLNFKITLLSINE